MKLFISSLLRNRGEISGVKERIGRDREPQTFTPGCGTISYFIVLPPRVWHMTDLKHLIIFLSPPFRLHEATIGQFTTEASTGLAYFFFFFWDHARFRHRWVLYIYTFHDLLLRDKGGGTSTVFSSHCIGVKNSVVVNFSDAYAPRGYSSF